MTTDPNGPRCYRLFGLTIQSELQLPIQPLHTSASADVSITRGPVSATLEDSSVRRRQFDAADDTLLYRWEGRARMLVRQGQTIRIESTGADESQLRQMVLGTGMAALLAQRGLVALHASAIWTQSGAVVCVGKRAAGKSTLAAAFAQLGVTVLADDISGVLVVDDVAWCVPGVPYVRLGSHSVAQLRIAADQPMSGETAPRKMAWVPATAEGVGTIDGAPIRQLIALRAAAISGASYETLPAAARLAWLHRHTRRREISRLMGDRARRMATYLRLAQTPMLAVQRPLDQSPLDLARVLADRLAIPIGDAAERPASA